MVLEKDFIWWSIPSEHLLGLSSAGGGAGTPPSHGGCSVVLAGQGVSHDTHQLLPGELAGRGEVLGEVGSQDNDEDVPEELEEKRKAEGLMLRTTAQGP